MFGCRVKRDELGRGPTLYIKMLYVHLTIDPLFKVLIVSLIRHRCLIVAVSITK